MYPMRYNSVIMEIKIEIYRTTSGKCPFETWFEKIREVHTRAKILTRLDRLKLGNFGDCKTLGNGLSELRIHYGPGIRIYYTKIGDKLICEVDLSQYASSLESSSFKPTHVKIFFEDTAGLRFHSQNLEFDK